MITKEWGNVVQAVEERIESVNLTARDKTIPPGIDMVVVNQRIVWTGY